LAKVMAKPDVGLRPNVACEFKRAGFPDGETIGTSLPTG
jgi:hypothetical protein